MKSTNILRFFSALFVALLFTACSKDAIEPGISVTVVNTLQTAADPSQGGTGGVETPIEAIFGVPAGSLSATATVGDGIEFDNYLSNLYDIDISAESIRFDLVAAANDPFYGAFFRTIEAGTFDRYYLTFSEDHNIKEASSDNASVSLRIISDNEVVVEVSEGFSFNPGSTFTITLD
ncbi:MAG: hypothetical protein AAF206_15965 [Bacteroidota bacterium]